MILLKTFGKGISQPTINRAKLHVEVFNKYPELKLIPTQKDALTIAKNLDALLETEREVKRQKIEQNDSDTWTELAEKPAMREREIAKGESPEEKWTTMLTKTSQYLMGITTHGGIDYLWRRWSDKERQSHYKTLCRLESNLSNLREEMEEILNYGEDGRENVA